MYYICLYIELSFYGPHIYIHSIPFRFIPFRFVGGFLQQRKVIIAPKHGMTYIPRNRDRNSTREKIPIYRYYRLFLASTALLPKRQRQPLQPSLLRLPLRRAVCDFSSILSAGGGTTSTAAGVSSRKNPQEHLHQHRSKDTRAQDPHHHQVTLPVLLPPGGLVVALPPGIQRVRRQDAAQVAPAGDDGGRGGDADLAVARLEELAGPGHGDGDGGAQAEPHDEKPAVARPGVGVGASVGGEQEAEDLEQDGEGEEEGAVAVEAVGEGGDEEDGDEVHLHITSQSDDLLRQRSIVLNVRSRSAQTASSAGCPSASGSSP